MAENENVQVVRDAYAAFQRGDIPGLLGLMSEDVTWDTPGATDVIPYAGSKRGREGVAGFFSALAGSERITHFEPREFTAQGDRVIVEGNYKGSVISTGRGYDIDWLHVFRIADGKIKSFREYIDTAALGEAHRAAAATTGGGA